MQLYIDHKVNVSVSGNVNCVKDKINLILY
jgi:hypothetical protein